MPKLNLSLASALLLAGCSQILGLGDYDIDQNLDGDGGAADEGGSGGKATTGGKTSSSGTSGSGDAGESPVTTGGKSNNGGTSGNPSAGAGGKLTTPQGGKGGTPPVSEGGAGGAPEPGPVVIPCDSVVCCTGKGGKPDAGVELLPDGGFELGPDGGVWAEESTGDYEAIIANDPSDPTAFKSHAGDYLAYLSGAQGERTSIYTVDLVIPLDAGWLTLTGYRFFQIDEMDATNQDFALIAFYDPDKDEPLEVPFWWGNPADHADGWGSTLATWKRFEASWGAAEHQGKTRYVGFRGESDLYPESGETLSSSYLFDTLSFKMYRCYK